MVTRTLQRADSQMERIIAAVTEWKNSAILSANSTNKYVIDANPSSDNKCDEFAAAVGATELQGNNAESMKTSFPDYSKWYPAPGIQCSYHQRYIKYLYRVRL